MYCNGRHRRDRLRRQIPRPPHRLLRALRPIWADDRVVAVVRDALIRRLVRQQRTDLGAVNASEQVLGHSENKMKRIPALIEALYRGHQLANVATWKANGTRLAAMSGFLSALVGIATAMG